ncbi:MAG: phosphatase PAP2 family protein [Actinomycetota bacterium]|nr:phosphatase PAP2 family protein [Actinomycetota bacterium]
MAIEVERDEVGAPTRLRWWREVLYVLAFYVVYSAVRNAGTGADSVGQAFDNAKDIIRLERLVGLYHEETIQEAFLSQRWFIQAWNVFYGSFHFVVTIGALVWCFRRRPDRYPRWRNTLAATTALALIGFAFYPLMPPRLLPTSYGYVDTLASYGGLWSFDSGTMKAVSNQYAAMPSLHFGWSSWSMFVLWPATAGRTWARVLLAAYPAATLFAIIVTANHFWLDAVGGAVVLAAGYGVATLLTRRSRAASSAEKSSLPS